MAQRDSLIGRISSFLSWQRGAMHLLNNGVAPRHSNILLTYATNNNCRAALEHLV